jgi:hypothetical protein
MDAVGISAPNKAVSILITALLVLGGIVVLYFLYKFLYGTQSVQMTTLVKKDIVANKTPGSLPAAPSLFEGGEYSVSTWMYVNSYNINRNRRKHVLEIGGSNFSTLLIALGAFKNTLLVRTHTQDADAVYSGSDSSGNSTPSCVSSSGTTYQTPSADQASRSDGSLKSSEVAALFKPLMMDDTMSDTSPVCDMPEIEMQRWTLVTVVLSGRQIDVYLDGKLARSCITRSYFKVDPTGTSVKLLQKPQADSEPGFDGYLSNVQVANYALNPADVYKIYASGPFGDSNDVMKWTTSLFKSD